MKSLLIAASLGALLLLGSARAQEAAPGASAQQSLASVPTDESIRELMRIANLRRLLDGTEAQAGASFDQAFQASSHGAPLTAQQREVVEDAKKRIIALIHDRLKWEIMEPVFIDHFKRVFTQQELDGIVAFYKTPAGQALIAKMPAIMNDSMRMMQEMMADLRPQISKIVEDSEARLKALR